MKNTKLIPLTVVVASILMFSACGAFSLGPTASRVASAFTKAANATALPVEVGAPPAVKPGTTNPQTGVDVASQQSIYEEIYQNVNPSVVTIVISSQASSLSGLQGGGQGDGQTPQGIVPTAQGSGFIWDTEGHIVTNNHVVSDAEQITVTFSDGSSFEAKVTGTDPNVDLAVIQVTGAPAELLKPIKVGDSTQVKVGQMVVAIGNPFGLANTMTTGIVSAIARSIQSGPGSSPLGEGNTPNFSIPDVIQTDAAINPGNSGGVLVDLDSALIGVPSQIESPSGSNSGIGFAIPSSIVSQVVPQLISKGVASHSYLGISGSTITPDVVTNLHLAAGQQGILVADVVADGPADKAGLKGTAVDANGTPTAAGDIITGVDGKQVDRFEDLVSYLYSSTQPGQSVTLDVLRDGQNTTVKVTLGTQPTK